MPVSPERLSPGSWLPEKEMPVRRRVAHVRQIAVSVLLSHCRPSREPQRNEAWWRKCGEGVPRGGVTNVLAQTESVREAVPCQRGAALRH